jgi:hypothetical protein
VDDVRLGFDDDTGCPELIRGRRNVVDAEIEDRRGCAGLEK